MTLVGADRATPVRAAASRPAPPRGRERATIAAWKAAESAIRHLPPDVALGLGARVGSAALTLSPRRFRGLRANLEHVVPDASERDLKRLLRRNVRNLARSWVEVLAMGSHGEELVSRVVPVNVENMLAPLERGRGVVIASLHLGSWETGIACWNRRFGSMSLLAEVLRPQELFDHIIATRSALGVHVIPIDTAAMRESADGAAARRLGAAALRDVIRALRANQLVAMAMDRDLIGNGVPLDFFGRPAPIPIGVVETAIRTGAAIVPIPLIRAGREVIAPCYPEVVYDASAPRDAEVRRVAAEVLRIFESIIRDHPDQWHVMDPIWSTPATTDTVAEAAA